MCSTCGCGDPSDVVTITKIGDEMNHEHFIPGGVQTDHHPHQHHHHHEHHEHSHHEPVHEMTTITLERDILQKNNLLAERNRGYFEAKNILALNLVSSPGSGKTSILERTLADLGNDRSCYVIEGDQQSSNDADRIARTNVPVVQINTGKGCHLDADMIHRSLKQLKPDASGIVFIENVGNLVCPAMFDLGENKRVVIISVTEGDDKPIKYPDMFHSSQLCLINKIDLLPYVRFDVEKAKEYALRINPHLKFIEVSATTGEGMDKWYQWLNENS
ncbi:MAG: hydrogenase nickel incorporation protein HypB [Saprospiraceae bacterium]|nr:hydrogenase nickel incorporation protein HypB [Saprospiraceae bacterium]